MTEGYTGINSILDILADDPVIHQYDVLLYEHTALKFQLKLRIEFTDQSILFTNDYIGAERRKYAFQWQRTDGTWLIRWDNAPHFPKLTSFPHHLHDYRTSTETVLNSYDISLADVLTYIRNQLAGLTL